MKSAQRGQGVDFDTVLAGGGAQREQTLLDPFELGRIVAEIGGRARQRRGGLGEFGGGAVERGGGLIQPPGRARRLFRDHPPRRAEAYVDAVAILQRGDGVGDRLGQLFAVHHQASPVRQRLFLVGSGVERFEFLAAVAQEGLFRAGALQRLTRLVMVRDGLFPGSVGGRGLLETRRERAEPVQRGAVAGFVEHAAARELAFDFDQRRADVAQRRRADRLVVDEGAAAAFGVDGAAQDQPVALFRSVEAVFVHDRESRVIVADREFGGDGGAVGGFVAVATDQRRIGARAQREAQRVQQDRFTRAGLAGQYAQPGGKCQLQPIDKDDVPDGERDEHPRSEDPVPGARQEAFAFFPFPQVLAGGDRIAVEIPLAAGIVMAEDGRRLAGFVGDA